MDDTFWKGLGLGTLVGAVLTEGGKQLFGAAVKRRSERAEARRKLVRDDVVALQARVDPLLKLALKYYGQPSESGKQDSQQLKTELKAFAGAWDVLNRRLAQFELTQLPVGVLVRFRKALTVQLDVRRDAALAADDPIIAGIQTASIGVIDALSEAKYRHT